MVVVLVSIKVFNWLSTGISSSNGIIFQHKFDAVIFSTLSINKYHNSISIEYTFSIQSMTLHFYTRNCIQEFQSSFFGYHFSLYILTRIYSESDYFLTQSSINLIDSEWISELLQKKNVIGILRFLFSENGILLFENRGEFIKSHYYMSSEKQTKFGWTMKMNFWMVLTI